jgi:hypothetical protein
MSWADCFVAIWHDLFDVQISPRNDAALLDAAWARFADAAPE